MDQITLSKGSVAELFQGYVEQLKNVIYQQGLGFLEIGRLFKIIRDEKLYRGGDYDSFQQFVSTSDISIKVSTAYSFIRLYELYVLQFGFSQEELSGISWGKLHKLAGTVAVANREEAELWLVKARELGGKDFDIEIEEYKGNKIANKKLPYPHFIRCKDCKKWKLIGNETSIWCECD